MQLEPQESVLESYSFAGDVWDTVQHQIRLPLVVVKYPPFIKEILILVALADGNIWLA